MKVPLPLLRFLASRELPFKDALLRRAGAWRHEPWRDARPRSCRGRWHGYRMTLDLRDYHQRAAYLFGRLLDVPVQLAIRDGLRPGDVFVDVGANIGVLMLLGARRVGPRGAVIALEPNPDVFRRLEAHVRDNGLGHVRLRRSALGDSAGVRTLSVPPTGNTGAGTLGVLPPRHGGYVLASYEVEVEVGDEALAGAPDAPMFIKIDVEGHEPHVLRGLTRTIEARRPAVLIEINPAALAGHGCTPADVLGPMIARGYRPFHPGARWGRLRRRWSLTLRRAPASWTSARTGNLLLLPADGVHADRFARFMIP